MAGKDTRGTRSAFTRRWTSPRPCLARCWPTVCWWELVQCASTLRTVFRIAFVPALLSIVVLSLIKDQPGIRHQREIIFETCKSISPEFKRFLAVAGIFSLADSLFGSRYGVHTASVSPSGYTVLLYALFNVAFVVAAPLIGKRGDIVGSARMIMLGDPTPLLMSLGFVFAATRRQVIVRIHRLRPVLCDR